MTEHEHPLSSEELHKTKDQLMTYWQQLPTEHRATMALVMVKDVITSDYGDWIRQALQLTITSTGGDIE